MGPHSRTRSTLRARLWLVSLWLYTRVSGLPRADPIHPNQEIVGAFLGSIFTSVVGENLGRKKTILIGVVIMIIGAILQATAYSRAHMIVGRIVSGFGMGAINSTVPVLQAEFSPKASRGVCKFSCHYRNYGIESLANGRAVVCAQLSTLNFGIFLVYWIDYGFSSSTKSYAWRVPVILQCIFLLGMLVILMIIPESPRWLAAHDRPDECLAVLQQLASPHDDENKVNQLHQTILQTVALEHSLHVGSWKDLLKNDHIKSQQRLLIACAIQSFQQLGGINAIICKPFPRNVSLTHRSHSL